MLLFKSNFTCVLQFFAPLSLYVFIRMKYVSLPEVEEGMNCQALYNHWPEVAV
jgi:hypothetical protein